MKKGYLIKFIFGWLLSLIIPLHYFLNEIFVDLEGCTQGSTDFYTQTTVVNVFIFIISLILIINSYKEVSKLWFLESIHLFSFIAVLFPLYKYLIYTTLNGISPCIVFDYADNMKKMYLPQLADWSSNISLEDKLFAPIGFIMIFSNLYIGLLMFRENKKTAGNKKLASVVAHLEK